MVGRFIVAMVVISCTLFAASTQELDEKAQKKINQLEKPMYNPFVERYLMDEVRDLRIQQQQLRVEMTDKITNSRLDVSDRAMNYVTNTVNNIFFILTAVASLFALFALFGWKSVKDAREQTKVIVQQRVEKVVEHYEKKLRAVEEQMQKRSEQIFENQERINRSNQVHALWRRSQLEDNVQAKVEIYDQILSIEPENVEALTYKADAVLDLGEKEWALNLCNQALELDDQYAYSFWQRACVNAELENVENAIADISQAISLSSTLLNDIESEKSFDPIRKDEKFIAYLESLGEVHNP